ncbi:ATP-binding protein (plasmid) [Streptomyces sp. BI20]|uniref:ATP-binding protein n=1 Tax=Streptomyces sp. BI20 TaxID=3403460 RepID=UPI003C745FC2
MIREKAPPRSTAAPPPLWPAALTGLPAVLAAGLYTTGWAMAAWVGGGLILAALVAVGVGRIRRDEAARVAVEVRAVRTAHARHEVELERMAGTVMPEVVARLGRGQLPEEVLRYIRAQGADGPPGVADSPCAESMRRVLVGVVDVVDAEEGLRDSAQRAFVNISRRVQAIVHQQAQEMREMEDRHGHSPDVFGDLLRLDHGTALIGRLADSISVLGGSRPGRQWSRAVPLYSVLRGAMSRIIDYQRVELHSVAEVAVVGPAVEPLIHSLAELLDNATRYSPPHTRVHLTASEVQAGIAVEIEDGGIGLSEEARRRVEETLRQAGSGIDLNDLGEAPRLGLSVVGRLAHAYGFQVSLRTSAYGGVRAVVIVPRELVTTAAAATGVAHGIGTASGPRASSPRPARSTWTVPAGSGSTPSVPTPSGSGRGVPAGAQPTPHPVQPPYANPTPHPAASPGRHAAGPPAPPPVAPQRAAPEPYADSYGAGYGDEAPLVTERTPGGLPQRRRKNRITAPSGVTPRMPQTDSVPDAPGLWLEAFHTAFTADPDARPDSSDGDPDQGTSAPGSEEPRR